MKVEKGENICQQLFGPRAASTIYLHKKYSKCQMCVYTDRMRTAKELYALSCLKETRKKIALVNPNENKQKHTT